jgi:hypothetical protein
MRVTLERYYKSFTKLKLLFAGIPFVPLLFHALAPSNTIAKLMYPPLGDVQFLAIGATVIFLFLTTFAVFISAQLTGRLNPLVPIFLMVGFLTGVGALIPLYVSFVRLIPVPSENKQVLVSVGYQRTEFAGLTYDKSSDWEMLHSRGPWEEQIQKLWTQRSISIVRFGLWSLYTVSLAFLLSVVSLAAYRHAGESLEQ